LGFALLQGDIIAKEYKYNDFLKKIFFTRTSWPNSIKLSTNYLWVKGIQVCSNNGQILCRGEIITKNVKVGWGRSFKNLLQNHRDNFKETLHKSSLSRGDLSLFK
jgi:hypothetical protein